MPFIGQRFHIRALWASRPSRSRRANGAFRRLTGGERGAPTERDQCKPTLCNVRPFSWQRYYQPTLTQFFDRATGSADRHLIVGR